MRFQNVLYHLVTVNLVIEGLTALTAPYASGSTRPTIGSPRGPKTTTLMNPPVESDVQYHFAVNFGKVGFNLYKDINSSVVGMRQSL